VPTIVVMRGGVMVRDTAMRGDARRAFVPPALAARWETDAARSAARPAGRIDFEEELHRRETAMVAAMHRAGVRILVGTDASDEAYVYAGSSVHDEMVLMAAAGMPTSAVLAAATVGPAEYLGMRDSLGTIESGKAADLVVLDGDPLADISNVRRVHAVISQGRLIGPAARDSLMARARAEAARAIPSPPADQ
jgi:imidazolonepropionase-like amidohydrolase